ncbi:hypothetical protein FEM48_Zijuj07G0087600 [Ziziphus jujuba var. spinosa]|uniref:Uncharacterized protein n=1 Tax=Ziziphus jujuba var. spinosa TaxID=714518 RepID=A0A978V3M9_ZIZJJ|nr:hypothetical protein FEM48_Zijuj07G0087600 [Ziziphus jujuba var. spinosa]
MPWFISQRVKQQPMRQLDVSNSSRTCRTKAKGSSTSKSRTLVQPSIRSLFLFFFFTIQLYKYLTVVCTCRSFWNWKWVFNNITCKGTAAPLGHVYTFDFLQLGAASAAIYLYREDTEKMGLSSKANVAVRDTRSD